MKHAMRFRFFFSQRASKGIGGTKMADESARIYRCLRSSRSVPGPSEGVIRDDTWSAEAHEWNVCCLAPYPTVSTKQYVPVHLYLYCIGLSAEPLSGPGFTSQAGKSLTTFFFDNAWTFNIMSSATGFTVIHPLSISANNCKSRTTQDFDSYGNACSEPSRHYNLASIKVA